MSCPGATGSGVSAFVSVSAARWTVVMAEPVLSRGNGSAGLLDTDAEPLMVVPDAADASTVTTMVKSAVAPAAKLDVLDVIVPALSGPASAQPEAPWKLSKWVPAGGAALSATFCAAVVPVFFTSIV